MTDERELSRRMRDGMVAEARRVTASPGFTEETISRALATGAPGRNAEPPRPPGWQNWVLPAVAAVLVALLVGSALVGTRLLHDSSRPRPAATQPGPSQPTPAPSSSVPSPGPSSAPSSGSTPAPSASPSGSAPAGPSGGPVPAGFRAYDLTWVSADDGWALGTAPCSSAPCTSIVRTTDGGRSWVGIPAPKAWLAPADTCTQACDRISELRFATPLIGYAVGDNSFWSTTDGGGSWQRQAGFGYALEVVGGSVLRVSAQAAGCAPGCAFTLQRSTVGGTSWQDVPLPGQPRSDGVRLSASGNTVVLASYANPAGGAEDETAVLFTSTDAGHSWRMVGEPCPRSAAGEVDTVDAAVAGDGSVSVLCQPRGQTGQEFTMTAPDGVNFHRGGALPAGQFPGALAATSASQLFVLRERLYRSTDGGGHWTPVPNGPASTGGSGGFLGFESTRVGRAVAGFGQDPAAAERIWTTTDGGANWRADSFG